MFSQLPLILVSILSLSGGDSIKKKSPVAPARGAKATMTATTVIARAASQTVSRFAGVSAGTKLSSVAQSLTPHASYLSAAFAAHMRPVAGPPLPGRMQTADAPVGITAD